MGKDKPALNTSSLGRETVPPSTTLSHALIKSAPLFALLEIDLRAEHTENIYHWTKLPAILFGGCKIICVSSMNSFSDINID